MNLALAPQSKKYGFRKDSLGGFHWQQYCLFSHSYLNSFPGSCAMAGCLLQAELWRQDYKEHHLRGEAFAEAYAQKHLWRAQAKLFEIK